MLPLHRCCRCRMSSSLWHSQRLLRSLRYNQENCSWHQTRLPDQWLHFSCSNFTGKLKSTVKPTFDKDSLLGTADWQGEKKRTFHEPKGDGEATIAKQVAGDENVIAQAINQYRGTEAEGQIANLVKTNLNQALQYYSMMTPKIEAGKANKQEMDAYELLGYYLNERAPKAQNVAYGGRIDKALTGRSRDI